DKAAPKGRLILPQQQVIRDILDSGAISIVTKEDSLKETLSNLGKKPKLVITDSQVFPQEDKDTPKDIPLTSFSILFARQKGERREVINVAAALEHAKGGDEVVRADVCAGHRAEGDWGTVRSPRQPVHRTGQHSAGEGG
ncbi:[FeFe] hydrogenase H-cluster maturation GTPase HydF, partial [Klebsiella pneumoniae]|nr:[FeFe] hydrogenase H-cluster maturation GTPase HydF [Klebsiella pneumoniae]